MADLSGICCGVCVCGCGVWSGSVWSGSVVEVLMCACIHAFMSCVVVYDICTQIHDMHVCDEVLQYFEQEDDRKISSIYITFQSNITFEFLVPFPFLWCLRNILWLSWQQRS